MFNEKLYSTQYHRTDLANKSFLITGGAGFIGSNLVAYLLKYGAGKVRVLDNLSNGYKSNIEEFLSNNSFEFIEGDIRDLDTCKRAVDGMDFISHQAALGSVPRSITSPTITNDVNVSGFVNMITAAKDALSLKRFVYAASSSTYGDSSELPKVEGREGKPLSPYAVSKAVNEYYAEVYSRVYGFHTIGLRYFNVFGPRQNADNPYAAVIPIFCKAFIEGNQPTIFGDGETSRDFTFVENAIQANMKAFEIEELCSHEVCNMACGDQVSLNEMVLMLSEISGKNIKPIYGPERNGDVKHSKASIEKIKKLLNFDPKFRFKESLKITYENYLANL